MENNYPAYCAQPHGHRRQPGQERPGRMEGGHAAVYSAAARVALHQLVAAESQ
jgi:hypothetical protein